MLDSSTSNTICVAKKTCMACQTEKQSLHSTASSLGMVFEPWQRIYIDFAGPFKNKMWLIVVDAHSKWPEVLEMLSTSALREPMRLHVFCSVLMVSLTVFLIRW